MCTFITRLTAGGMDTVTGYRKCLGVSLGQYCDHGAWHYLILAKLYVNLLHKGTDPHRYYQGTKLPTSACLHQTLMFLRWAFVKWSHAFCLEAEWYTATICSTAASNQQLDPVTASSRDSIRGNKRNKKRSIRLLLSSI